MTKTQLYHSMKSEHLLDIIENGGWKKLSTHFLYSSFSDKEKYGKCVNGLCLSRDSNFVKNWNGDIVVVFDKGEIQKKYKIKPINWSFSNTYHNTKKAVKNGEFEEFVVLKTSKSTMLSESFKNIIATEISIYLDILRMSVIKKNDYLMFKEIINKQENFAFEIKKNLDLNLLLKDDYLIEKNDISLNNENSIQNILKHKFKFKDKKANNIFEIYDIAITNNISMSFIRNIFNKIELYYEKENNNKLKKDILVEMENIDNLLDGHFDLYSENGFTLKQMRSNDVKNNVIYLNNYKQLINSVYIKPIYDFISISKSEDLSQYIIDNKLFISEFKDYLKSKNIKVTKHDVEQAQNIIRINNTEISLMKIKKHFNDFKLKLNENEIKITQSLDKVFNKNIEENVKNKKNTYK